MPLRQFTQDRFWSHVDFDGPIAKNRPDLGACWLWTARISGWGYGEFSLSWRPMPRVRTYAHVFAWELANRQYKPMHLELDHFACDRRDCCNPAHLALVTHVENVMRNKGFGATNARKDACPVGHLYQGENLMLRKNGDRRCRTCVYEQNRKGEQRRKAMFRGDTVAKD